MIAIYQAGIAGLDGKLMTLGGAGQITGVEATDRPIFVFAQHRGGGTLMLRLLNCHPDVVIWGEHAGFINKLAETDQVIRYYGGLIGPRSDEEFTSFLASDGANLAHYSPWLTPLTVEDFTTWSRTIIREVFTRRVRSDQRWGFKEIRYHHELVATFLARLFPGGRFILLTRDPVELCVSNVLVSWSLASLMAKPVTFDLVEITKVVEDCLYAIVAMQTNMKMIRRALPDRTLLLTYDELKIAPAEEMERVQTFLGLAPTPAVQERMLRAIAVVASSTVKQRLIQQLDDKLALLTVDLVRPIAANLLPRVTDSIASHGVDLVRLRRLSALGRYSYLVGDVELPQHGISAMF
jgi:hypothetical protein